MSLYGKILQVCNRSVTIEKWLSMKSRLKKITIFSLVFFFIFGTAITTTPKQQVKADDGYNGKIFETLVQIKRQQIKKIKKF